MEDITRKPYINAADDKKISSFYQEFEGWKSTLLRNIEMRITRIGWKKSDFTL
jgi:hypothetical protein